MAWENQHLEALLQRSHPPLEFLQVRRDHLCHFRVVVLGEQLLVLGNLLLDGIELLPGFLKLFELLVLAIHRLKTVVGTVVEIKMADFTLKFRQSAGAVLDVAGKIHRKSRIGN